MMAIGKMIAGVVLVMATATGCAVKTQATVEKNRTDAQGTIDQKQAGFRAMVAESEQRRIEAQEVNRPFLAGEVRPLARAVQMPEQLRKSVPVTALFQRSPVDFETAMRQISEATGMRITATPDAMLPPAAFSMRIGGQASVPVMGPARVVLSAQGVPLWALLDDVARQAQVSWKPLPDGAEFFRVETRVFELSAIGQVANTSATLGRNAGSNATFESQSKTSFASKDLNVLASIQASVDAMLTTGGKSILSNESQTLIVTDVPHIVEKVGRYIEEQNRSLSRRVRVLVEAIEVVDKDGSEVGLDWALIYNAANSALKINSPSSVTGTQAGSFALSATTGRFAGTSPVIKALNEVGVVVNRREFALLTTSGRPVTQAIRSTFNYIDQVQLNSIASSASTIQTPSVTQKDETVGTFMTIVPTARSDGSIFLSLSFDQTTAQPLVPLQIGPASSSVILQQKVIDGSGVIQEVPIRSGQAVVVGGFESNVSQNTIRRLANGVPMIAGGSDQAKVTKTKMVLLVTAVIEEGV